MATENDIKEMFTTVGHLIDGAKAPVLGDFNLPKVNWIKCISSIKKESVFHEYFFQYGLVQLVTIPTRGQNTLDLIFQNDDLVIANSITALPPPNTCDHQPILFQFKGQVKSQQPSHSTNYDFASGDYNRINSILSLTDWNSFFCGCVTIDNYWLKWLNYVHQLITDFITRRKVKKRKQKPVPAHFHRIINHRTKLWKKYRKCNNKQTK